MIAQVLSSILDDKQIPVGEGQFVTCSSLFQMYNNCKAYVEGDQQSICGQYYKLSLGCYISSHDQAKRLIQKEADGFTKLMRHLSSNGSDIPRRLNLNGNINYLNLLMLLDEEEKQKISEQQKNTPKPNLKDVLEANKEYFDN